MDEDTREVVTRLEGALARSGLSLRGFAAALGTSHSRLSSYLRGTSSPSAAFFLRALRLGNALGEAEAAGWMTPPRTAGALATALARDDERWAFKLVTQARDQVASLLASPGSLVDAWEARPGTSGDDRWDALLAALVGHEFTAAGRTPPAWTDRPPLVEWVMPNLLLDVREVRRATPEWLAERGIFIAGRDLVTA